MNNKYKYKKNKYNNSNYIQNRSKPKKKGSKRKLFRLKTIVFPISSGTVE